MKDNETIETKVASQGINSATQETLALLKILAISASNIKQGKSQPLKEAFADIRKKIKDHRA